MSTLKKDPQNRNSLPSVILSNYTDKEILEIKVKYVYLFSKETTPSSFLI